MKNYIYLFIPLYFLVSLITLYGLIYEEVEIVIPGLLSLVLLLMIVFMLNTYSLKNKYEIDENVLHLTREILHELNIPISTIQANTSLIRRKVAKDEKMLKRLSRIEDASRRLERLYEELHYSIKKEIKTVNREEVNIGKLVEERIEIMKQLHRNDFSLKVEACNVMVDKIGFEKMLDNILSNAMKYSSKQSVISVSLKEGLLKIEDKGIGIEDRALKDVYRRYYQGNKEKIGEGIGLALVEAYCKDEKIAIVIESKKFEGTIVTLDLRKIVI